MKKGFIHTFHSLMTMVSNSKFRSDTHISKKDRAHSTRRCFWNAKKCPDLNHHGRLGERRYPKAWCFLLFPWSLLSTSSFKRAALLSPAIQVMCRPQGIPDQNKNFFPSFHCKMREEYTTYTLSNLSFVILGAIPFFDKNLITTLYSISSPEIFSEMLTIKNYLT